MNDKDFVAAQSRKLGIDSVLVTKLVDKKTVQTSYPAEFRDTVSIIAADGTEIPCGNVNCFAGHGRPEHGVVLDTSVYELNADKRSSLHRQRHIWKIHLSLSSGPLFRT